MKKVLTVVAVLIMFLLVFAAQNSLAQNDPFEIGKEIAMSGKFYSPIWSKYEGNFGVSYSTEQNAVAFEENPESGNGTAVWWIKDLGPNTYSKYTFIIENDEIKTPQEVSITKEKAEQEAWKILGYLGYSK